jgi:tRNA (cytidine/uridine-2'-O-)-methyltransferase
MDIDCMFHIVLVSPEIPPNTGNVIRLAANTGASLHLVRPLGFELEDKKLKRAGLDYHEWACLRVHDSLEEAFADIGGDPRRRYALTTKGTQLLGEASFSPGDVFVFGRETAGLTNEQMALFPDAQRLRLPMLPEQRSLNLSNAVAVTIYEAWRQAGYAGSI